MYIYLMLLSRNQFFLLLLLVFVVPIVAYKVCWLARSQRTLGVMCFTGHTLETIGVSRHPVIRYRAGNDSIFFNGNSNVDYHDGDLVPVRYRQNNPYDARIDIPVSIWGDTLAWALFPFLLILVLYLTPERLQPLIPRSAAIRLSRKRPYIRIVSPKFPAYDEYLP